MGRGPDNFLKETGQSLLRTFFSTCQLISGCYGTHAYCINAAGAEVLLRMLPEISSHVDCEISLLARRYPDQLHLRETREAFFHNESARQSISWFWNVPMFQIAGWFYVNIVIQSDDVITFPVPQEKFPLDKNPFYLEWKMNEKYCQS